jgi:glutaminyl-peptide cyclotransferase
MTMKNRYVIILTLLILAACNNQGGEKKQQKQVQQQQLKTMPFSPDSAYKFVADQVAFGPRVVGTKAHAKCADYLILKLKSWSNDVVVQEGSVAAYNGTQLRFKNIIASFGPAGNNRILLAAHWDSRPYADYDPDPANRRKPIDGANDGASGVGVLLEIARQMSTTSPPVGVDIVLFDAEDYGPPQDERADEDTQHYWGLGSQYWATQPHRPDYAASFGILLDMVGARNATFLMEGFSMDYASWVVSRVWDIGTRLGYNAYFIHERAGYITDDHVPVNRILKIPMIDLIHLDQTSRTGFYPYWHTTGDRLDKIDPLTLEVVGRTVMGVVYNP